MGTFTQPVAVFVSKGPACGTTIAKLIIQVITLLEKSGAKIHGVISDGATQNRKFWSLMGVTGKLNNVKSWFPHPTEEKRQVFVFSDTPHLIKNIRNSLCDKREMRVSKQIIKY